MVTISDLLPGRPYYVRIRAYKLDSTGSKVYGAYSANKSYKTAPEAPQISKLTGGSQKITIAWNKVDGAENYQVYMSTSKSGTYTRIATLNSDATSYAKSGLDIA